MAYVEVKTVAVDERCGVGREFVAYERIAAVGESLCVGEPANPWARGAWNQLVTDIDDSEYIMLRGVDFGKGAKEFSIDAMSHLYGGNIEIRTDSPDGPLAGIVEVGCTKDEMQRFTTLHNLRRPCFAYGPLEIGGAHYGAVIGPCVHVVGGVAQPFRDTT